MNRAVCLLAAVLSVFLASCRSGEPPAGGESSKTVLIVNHADAIPAAMAGRVADYAREQLQVELRLLAAGSGELGGLDAAIDWLADMPKRGPMNIVLASCPADEEHLRVDQGRGLAAVNTAALECEDPKVFARRVERMVMRSAGTLAGLGFDPDPFCVMHSYETLDDLDSMGRNFSPPWQLKFLRSANAMGLEPVNNGSPGTQQGEEQR